MESQRPLLFIGLLLVSYLLWIEYQEAYGPQPLTPPPQTVADQGIPSVPSASTNSLPSATPSSNNGGTSSASDIPTAPGVSATTTELNTQTDRFITVTTDALDITIDLVGGDVVRADLVKYPVTEDSDDSYELLKPDLGRLHIAQSGLVGAQGPDSNPQGRPQYSAPQSSFQLNGETLIVPLTWSSADG